VEADARPDLERLLAVSRDLLAVSDADGRYVLVRGGWTRLLGYEPSELEGREYREFLHPDDVDRTLAFVADAMAAGRPLEGFTNRLRAKDGSYRHARWFAEAAGDGYWYACAEDVTESVDAYAELESQRELMAQTEAVSRLGSWRLSLANGTVQWSDEMYELFGIDKASFTGDPSDAVARAVHPDDQAMVDALTEGVLVGGSPVTAEYRIVKPDGTFRWVRAQGAQELGADGAPVALVGYVQDITERKAAEEALQSSEKRYRELFESMLEGLAVCEMLYDEDGTPVDWVYLEVNDMFEPLSGLKDVVGKRVTEIIPGIRETNPDLFELYARAARDGVKGSIETDLPQLGLSLRIAVYNAGPDRFIAVFEDIAERRRAQSEIRVLNESLEARVSQRTAELESANAELQRANARLAQANAELDEATRAKNDFLASMSHELRTPLNSILGFSGTLLQGMAGELTNEQRRQLAMINNSGRHLLDLISRVLDLAKIESGLDVPELEELDPVEVAHEMVETIRPLAEEKGLRVLFHADPAAATVTADRRRLCQILLNLLGNAVKFTDAGSVELSVEPEGRGASFIVRDTGRGIAEGELGRIFEDFYQGASPDGGKIAGTGLGLAVSQRLAFSMGGRIEADSREGEGSTFTLRLS